MGILVYDMLIGEELSVTLDNKYLPRPGDVIVAKTGHKYMVELVEFHEASNYFDNEGHCIMVHKIEPIKKEVVPVAETVREEYVEELEKIQEGLVIDATGGAPENEISREELCEAKVKLMRLAVRILSMNFLAGSPANVREEFQYKCLKIDDTLTSGDLHDLVGDFIKLIEVA